MRTRDARVGLVLALIVALSAACSGAPRPGTNVTAAKQSNAAGDSEGGEDTTVLADGTVVSADGTPVDGAAPATPGGTLAPGAAARPGTAVAGGAAPTAGGGGGGAASPGGPFIADLFSGSADTVGISANKITLCGHAALIFAQAFDTRPEDLNVYWQARGPIHGRTVDATWEDDQYSSDEAVNAAAKCRDKNPFILLGGIGFDQIPNVRAWAEQKQMLYFHHIAVEAGADDKRYSFTAQPSVEAVGRAFGEFIATKYRTQPIGIVYRRSDNWTPGRDAGKAVMQAAKMQIKAEMPVERNQSLYSAQIRELEASGAKVVWLWENALGAAEFIKQSYAQQYTPTFVVFPFQTTLDVLGAEATKSRIEGVATWPAYKVGGYGNEFAQFGYGEEIRKFEQAYARFRPGVKPNDILWQTWLGSKLLDDMFTRCGRECTRNRFAGLMLGGYQATVAPNCAVDFARHPHRGGYSYYGLEAYQSDQGPAFRTRTWCAERFG